MSKAPAPTTNGGQPKVVQPPYCPPQGPKQNPPGPGLGGTNHGTSGTQGK